MVGFFGSPDDPSPDFSPDNDNTPTSTSGIYSAPDGTNTIAPNMTPSGGAFTMGQWGTLFQTRADTAQTQADNDNPAPLSDQQTAQMLPPSTIFTKPPVEIVKPPLPEFPQDITKSPGPVWEWNGPPGS